ncbi:MAG: nucleoside kinase [Rhodobacteraceae bacterium]|nr:nucleoside kinase [Paracoccaceae bacterium]
MNGPVIHLCGWPGTGKATIGTLLATRLGGRLIDNHLALDPASALFERSDPRHVALRQTLRAAIDAAALTLPPEVPRIVTDALSDEPEDAALFAPTRALARARGAALHCITFDISPEENRRRLCDPARASRAKLTDPKILDRLRANHRHLRPEGSVSLDVTGLDPAQAATAIRDALGLAETAPT